MFFMMFSNCLICYFSEVDAPQSPKKEKDQLSVYSAQSMMSIQSDIGTSLLDKVNDVNTYSSTTWGA